MSTTDAAREADTSPDRDIISVIKAEFATKERADSLRHQAVVALANDVAAQRVEIVDLKGRMSKVERNSFPTLPIWALFGVGVGELALHIAMAAVHR